MDYSILLQYDPVDKIYVASIPELPGCIAHGKTQSKAVEEINTAKELWLETAREMNIEIPAPRLYNTVA